MSLNGEGAGWTIMRDSCDNDHGERSTARFYRVVPPPSRQQAREVHGLLVCVRLCLCAEAVDGY